MFLTTSLLLKLCCSEAAVSEITRIIQLPKFDFVYFKLKLTDFDNFGAISSYRMYIIFST